MIVVDENNKLKWIDSERNRENLPAEDYVTCPGCRVAVMLGQTCPCPMKTKGH